MVFTKSYMVYLPEGYDGLVFAAELEEDNYEDFMKRKRQSDHMAESYIMDGDSEEPYWYEEFQNDAFWIENARGIYGEG